MSDKLKRLEPEIKYEDCSASDLVKLAEENYECSGVDVQDDGRGQLVIYTGLHVDEDGYVCILDDSDDD